jgi:hypothetical protein
MGHELGSWFAQHWRWPGILMWLAVHAGRAEAQDTYHLSTFSVFSRSQLLLAVGDTLRLVTERYRCPGGGDVCMPAPAPGPTRYASADPAILTISRGNLATARRPGLVRITVRSGALTGFATARVLPAINSIAWHQAPAAPVPGDTVRISATFHDQTGREVGRSGAHENLSTTVGEVQAYDDRDATIVAVRTPGTLVFVVWVAHRADTLRIPVTQSKRDVRQARSFSLATSGHGPGNVRGAHSPDGSSREEQRRSAPACPTGPLSGARRSAGATPARPE